MSGTRNRTWKRSAQGTRDADDTAQDSLAQDSGQEVEEPEFETKEELQKYFALLVKQRKEETAQAIKDGKIDAPGVRRRLEDALVMKGTCTDMCARFERYERMISGNIRRWEKVPGTNKVDHKRCVRAFARANGDVMIPSDVRPPHILKKTLDYLFRELIPLADFKETFTFIYDRTRAIRTDFTIQHENGPLAIECFQRCARFSIIGVHFFVGTNEWDANYDIAVRQSLISLQEFYMDNKAGADGRPVYVSPAEAEFRVYHILHQIRDKTLYTDVPPEEQDVIFKCVMRFRAHIHQINGLIAKTSKPKIDAKGMQIFQKLVGLLHEQGDKGMMYLVACILQSVFGRSSVPDIEHIKGDLTWAEIIDGVQSKAPIMDGYHKITKTSAPSGSPNVQVPGANATSSSQDAIGPLPSTSSSPAPTFGEQKSSPFSNPFGVKPKTDVLPPSDNATSTKPSPFGEAASGPSPFGVRNVPAPTPSPFAPSASTPSDAGSATSSSQPILFGIKPSGEQAPSAFLAGSSAFASLSAPSQQQQSQANGKSIFGGASSSSPFGSLSPSNASSPPPATKPADHAPGGGRASNPFGGFGQRASPSAVPEQTNGFGTRPSSSSPFTLNAAAPSFKSTGLLSSAGVTSTAQPPAFPALPTAAKPKEEAAAYPIPNFFASSGSRASTGFEPPKNEKVKFPSLADAPPLGASESTSQAPKSKERRFPSLADAAPLSSSSTEPAVSFTSSEKTDNGPSERIANGFGIQSFTTTGLSKPSSSEATATSDVVQNPQGNTAQQMFMPPPPVPSSTSFAPLSSTPFSFPPTTTSSTPSLTPPQRPVINTSFSITSFSQPRTPITAAPGAPKHDPVSLPSTPAGVSSFAASAFLPPPTTPDALSTTTPTASGPTATAGSSKPSIRLPKEFMPMHGGVLSPLPLGTPGVEKMQNSFAAAAAANESALGLKGIHGTPHTPTRIATASHIPILPPSSSSTIRMPVSPTTPSSSLPPALPLNGKDKGKGKDVSSSPDHLARLDSQALDFARHSLLMRHSLTTWQRRATDRAAWREACRRSEVYSSKVNRERERASSFSSAGGSERKRVLSSVSRASAPTVVKKRKRPRPSFEQALARPKTDDELAERLRNNQKMHEKSWGQGTLVQTVKRFLQESMILSPSNWGLWMSVNGDVDGTYLSRQLGHGYPLGQGGGDIIPVRLVDGDADEDASSGEMYPGLIVFELSPLDEEDDLDRRKLIVDDCLRLRSVIEELPPDRHYVPALLVLSWASKPESKAEETQFTSLCQKYVEESSISSFSTAQLASKAMDLVERQYTALKQLVIDTSGRLVRKFTVHDLFKVFEVSWRDFVTEWDDVCWEDDEFQWTLYDRMIEAASKLMDEIVFHVAELIGKGDALPSHPSIDMQGVDDSDVAFERVISWLRSHNADSVISSAIQDLEIQRDAGKEFLPESFTHHIRQLALSRLDEAVGGTPNSSFLVATASIDETLRGFETSVNAASLQLQTSLSKASAGIPARRSPKRRLDSEDTAPVKRAKVMVDFMMEDELSFQDDSSSVTESRPPVVVSVAMLKALTKDIKKKYGS